MKSKTAIPQAKHLKQLKTLYERMRPDATEIARDFRALPKERREEVVGGQLWWAWAYELSMIQLLALLFWCLNLKDKLVAAANSSGDKTQAVLDLFSSVNIDDEEVKALFEGEAGEFRKVFCFCLVFALMHQFECVEREGNYLSDLVRRGGQGEDAAFFRALHIDRTIVSCPTFGKRITRAEIEGDDDFFKSVSNLLRRKWRKTSPKKTEKHNTLRLMLQASDEMGILKNLSMTERDQLFIQELGVFDEGEDPARSLQRFISRWINNR